MTQELTPDETAVLIAALGAMGDQGGGGRGARFTAKRLKANIFETTAQVAGPMPAARELVARVLAELGGPTAELQAVIGSGSMNLNPAVVTVTLTEDETGTVTAHLRGVAKEGLIRQRAGEKAARRVVTHLTDA